MARSSTTSDVFNAIAEKRRRQIINLLSGRERTVNDLVDVLGFSQPQVSKHLSVLRQVGLVAVRFEGRRRWYRLEAEKLRPIFEWAQTFEQFWDHQLSGIKSLSESRTRIQKTTKTKRK